MQRFVQRNARVFENSADLAGELFAAFTAFPEAVANALRRIGGDFVRPADHAAAMRAFCAIRPKDAFEESVGRFFVAEVWRLSTLIFAISHEKHRFNMT